MLPVSKLFWSRLNLHEDLFLVHHCNLQTCLRFKIGRELKFNDCSIFELSLKLKRSTQSFLNISLLSKNFRLQISLELINIIFLLSKN